jgi:hypothetical protein
LIDHGIAHIVSVHYVRQQRSIDYIGSAQDRDLIEGRDALKAYALNGEPTKDGSALVSKTNVT